MDGCKNASFSYWNSVADVKLCENESFLSGTYIFHAKRVGDVMSHDISILHNFSKIYDSGETYSKVT